jgi:hypothetical protein
MSEEKTERIANNMLTRSVRFRSRPKRVERDIDILQEDHRSGGGHWGNHPDYSDPDDEEGRKSRKPTTRGGGNRGRWNDLENELED